MDNDVEQQYEYEFEPPEDSRLLADKPYGQICLKGLEAEAMLTLSPQKRL